MKISIMSRVMRLMGRHPRRYAALALLFVAVTGAGPATNEPKKESPRGPSSAQPNADHTGPGRVYDAALGISLVPPAGWRRAEPDKSYPLRFFEPKTKKLRASVSVSSSDGNDMPLKKMSQVAKLEMPLEIKGWKFVGEGFTKLQGRPAYFVIGTLRLHDVDAQQMQYVLRGDSGKLYTITFSAPKQTFASFRKSFEDCAKSVRCD